MKYDTKLNREEKALVKAYVKMYKANDYYIYVNELEYHISRAIGTMTSARRNEVEELIRKTAEEINFYHIYD